MIAIPDDCGEPKYFSKKAGGFCGMPQSTVQLRTDDGCIIPAKDTEGGTGHRRKYSILNCIEMGLIKAMSDSRVPVKKIKGVMFWLRTGRKNLAGEPSRLEEYLWEDFANLVIPLKATTESNIKLVADYVVLAYSEKDKKINYKRWFEVTQPRGVEGMILLNITAIARKVLEAIE